jgi:peptide/nickel transport system substrate-binding protein
VAITADCESLNPVFSFSFQEVNISELLYLSLVQYEWNDSSGDVNSEPMAAKSWVWNNDSSSVTVNLRDDINWSDGIKLTTEDVIFSFDVYSDPDIQSRLFGSFSKLFLETNQHIDLNKSFSSVNPYKLVINFRPGSNPGIFDFDIPILPKHVYANLDRKKFAQLEKGIKSVTSGPFNLYKWNTGQSIILRANEKSFLHKPGTVNELVFKIIPDYNSRVVQIKDGEIDFMDNVKPDQLADLKSMKNIITAPVKGRQYDYAAWNNIDPVSFSGKKGKPNELFANSNIRTALSYIINKKEILSGFLGNNGDLASGPVAPIFKDAFNKDLKPREYDPAKAKELFKREGWNDSDNDGIMEKNGKKFSFTLNYPGGNPLREFAATIIKNDFKAVGIEVKTEPLEPGVYFEKMLTSKLNAWLGGWSVPIPLDLKPYWFSDLSVAQLNVVGYKNPEVDQLLEKIEKTKYPTDKNALYLKLQEILYADSPVTFLYWIDDITAYNNKVKNIRITPLGSIHHCWNWAVN